MLAISDNHGVMLQIDSATNVRFRCMGQRPMEAHAKLLQEAEPGWRDTSFARASPYGLSPEAVL